MTAKLKEYSVAELNAMPKSARPIGVAPIMEKTMTTKYADRKRTGKTSKDKASGSWDSRFKNRDARVEWQNDNRASNGTFPG